MFAKFPISTNFENDELRLLLAAVVVQDATPAIFDSYERKMELITPGGGI